MDFHAALLGLCPSEVATAAPAAKPTADDEFHLSLLGLTCGGATSSSAPLQRAEPTQRHDDIAPMQEIDFSAALERMQQSPPRPRSANKTSPLRNGLIPKFTSPIHPPAVAAHVTRNATPESSAVSDVDEFQSMLLGLEPKGVSSTQPCVSPTLPPKTSSSPTSRAATPSLKRQRTPNEAQTALMTNNNVLQYYSRLQQKMHPQVHEECRQMGSTYIHRVSWTMQGDVFEAAAGAPSKKNAQKEAYRRLLVQVPVDDEEEDKAAEAALLHLKKILGPTISANGLVWDVPARGTETERFEAASKAELYSKIALQTDRLVKMQKSTEVQKTLVDDMRDLLADDKRKMRLYSHIQNSLRAKVDDKGNSVSWTFTDRDGQQIHLSGYGAGRKEKILVQLGMLPDEAPRPPTVKWTDLATLSSFHQAWWWQLPFWEWFQRTVKDPNVCRVNQFMEQLVRLSGIAPIPANLWEKLLEEAAYCLRPHAGARISKQGQGEETWRAVALLDQLGHIEVDAISFSSSEAQQYFCHHRLMVAYEQWASVQHVGVEAMGGRDWNCSLATVKYVSESIVTVAGVAEDLDENDVVVVASKSCSRNANIGDPYSMPCPCRVVKTGHELTIRPLDSFPGAKGDFVKLYSAETYEIIQRRSLALQTLTRSLPFTVDPRAGNLTSEFTATMKQVLIHGDATGGTGASYRLESSGDAQQDAVAAACDDSLPLTLIQGPPGTGKTFVCCAILQEWHNMPHTGKLLAVADTNVAADNIQEGLRKRGVQSLRLGVGGDDELAKEQFRECSKFVCYVSALQKKDRRALVQLRQEMTLELLKTVDVIIATCIGAGNENYAKITFSKVIIDECTQAVEASSIVALGRRAHKVVLVGDHEQLPPTVFCQRARDMGFDQSLYERMRSQLKPFILTTQRRMHPQISMFPRNHTYGGMIKDGVTAEDRPPIYGVKWPHRVLLVDTNFRESSKGVSKMNPQEAQAVIATLRHVINRGGVRPHQVGVLTPYNAQKRVLIDAMKDDAVLQGVKVDSVDGFQGKERDLILFSAVRCNDRHEVGFLKDNRRCNVMLTRARRGLIVFGHKRTLRHDPIWKKWIAHLAPRHAIIPFDTWTEANLI